MVAKSTNLSRARRPPVAPGVVDDLPDRIPLAPGEVDVVINFLSRLLDRLNQSSDESDQKTSTQGDYLTVAEAAAISRRQPRTIRAWISRGALRASRPAGGRQFLIQRADLDRLLRS